jgi:simple sugar transport system ATP-binding protein
MRDTAAPPLIEARSVSRFFGNVVALSEVSLHVHGGEVVCLLGDNGAGKSTLIKMLSGLERPDAGTIAVDGVPAAFNSPRDAFARGIATVYQDLAILPEMSISRNFMLGMEPIRKFGPLRLFDEARAGEIAREELAKIGITVHHLRQKVGTMSGGERQSLAIARAEYRGARLLILDEPTSALGVNEAAIVLRHIIRARARGRGVVFITHNVRHALPIGDRFVILRGGRVAGEFPRAALDETSLNRLMGGGAEFDQLQQELAELDDRLKQTAAGRS